MGEIRRPCLLAAVLLLAAGAASAAPPGAWPVSRREVPVPAAASPELRQMLAAVAPPDVSKVHRNVPRTPEEWKQAAGRRAEAGARATAALARSLSVSVETAIVAGVPVRYLVPAEGAPEHRQHLFVHLHGGAYVFNGGAAGAYEGVLIAARARIPVVSVDYRMPPDHPFPAAVDDVVKVYRHLLRERPPGAIGMGGTSAGGGLALAVAHKLKASGVPLPGALFAGTPWSDLTKTGDSLFTNEGIDHVLVSYDGPLAAAARLYAGGRDLRDPLLSPVYGDFQGFPPTYLVTGTRDLLLSDTVRTHRKMRSAGVTAELNVYEGLSHADYVFAKGSPESRQVYQELGEFLAKHLE